MSVRYFHDISCISQLLKKYCILLQAGAMFASINDDIVYMGETNATNGFVAFGTSGYFMAEFDDFKLN